MMNYRIVSETHPVDMQFNSANEDDATLSILAVACWIYVQQTSNYSSHTIDVTMLKKVNLMNVINN